MKINSISIDSTNSITELCLLGVKYPTDKSPYNTDPSLHKHAYTSIYNLLFSNIRYNDLRIGELGILENHSMLSWREFFPNAKLYGFEWFDGRLDKAIGDGNNYEFLFIDFHPKSNQSMFRQRFDVFLYPEEIIKEKN